MTGLRFLMVTTFYPPYHFGGDAIGIQRLCHGLVRRGHSVTVLYDRDAFDVLSGGEKREPEEQPDGLVVHSLSTRAKRLHLLLTQQTGRPMFRGRQIRRVLAGRGFDVINFHNVSLVGGPGVLRYGDAVKLYMAHEHWLVCPTHVLWRHNREVCTGRQCIRCVLRNRRPPQYWRYTGLLRRSIPEIDTFIAMSRFSREKHREFGFPGEMEVLPYFLPDGGAAAGEGGPSPHDRPYFLFVGRLEKIKGLDDVIPVFRDFPGADLLIAGDGHWEEKLRSIAEGMENVRFLGRVSQERLDALYRHARALIVPSVCYETFGIIVIESFRHGTPVVVRRIGPLPEIVEEAAGGEIFGSTGELRQALGRLVSDDEHRRRLGENGYAAWRRLWSEEAVIPAYLDIVRRAAARRGREDILGRLTRRETA